MRIIAGAFKGRALAALGKGDAGAHLRPTTDRIRESLFNVLAGAYGDPVSGAVVLDLFAGTGALGLEALSRGASEVTFVENGRKSGDLLRQNIRLCRAESATRILRADARRLPAAPRAADLIFLDPPYGMGLGAPALQNALAQGWITGDALIVWEDNAEPTPPDGMTVIEARRFGSTTMTFLKPATGTSLSL